VDNPSLSKVNISLNKFKFNREVNPRNFSCEPQTPWILKKKLLDGKRIPWWEISKEILFTTSSERMVYYLRYATRMKGVVLEVLLLQQVRF
jgi:hypothetical protein